MVFALGQEIAGFVDLGSALAAHLKAASLKLGNCRFSDPSQHVGGSRPDRLSDLRLSLTMASILHEGRVQNQRGARPSVHRPKKRRTIATRRLIRRLSPSCPLAGCEARCEHSPSAARTIRHAEACQEGGSARVRAGGQIAENLRLARAISALASGRSWTHPDHLH